MKTRKELLEERLYQLEHQLGTGDDFQERMLWKEIKSVKAGLRQLSDPPSLSIYEHDHRRGISKLVIAYSHFDLKLEDRLPLGGYLIPLSLVAEGKTLLTLGLSSSQVSRLARYIGSKVWTGGFTMCPWHSFPPECSIHAVSELPGRTEWGLAFIIQNLSIEWLPGDSGERMRVALREWVKKSYELRQLEPRAATDKPAFDTENWKRFLFSIEGD